MSLFFPDQYGKFFLSMKWQRTYGPTLLLRQKLKLASTKAKKQQKLFVGQNYQKTTEHFGRAQGCHGHRKVMDFLEFLEKSWNFD